MHLSRSIILFLACLVSIVVGDECLRNAGLKENGRVTLSNCDKPPCILKKKTSTNVELKFAPKQDVTSLTNSVSAEILGVPFPFVGVDGANVCDKLFDAETGAKVSCPLKAGKEYVYKDAFKILEIYPKINVLVHWALKNNANEDVLCFEVPAKIVS